VRGAEECFVLCVDDDADFVKSLELFLPNRIQETCSPGPRYRFLFFTDPQDALESLDEILNEQGVLTMVISDQQMPQMRGTAFLARIRERCPACIRVLLTGHAGLESAITAINDRLLDKYLTKPVDNEHDFTLSISHLLQRFWMQRTIESQRRMIGDLYRFSNTLGALTDLRPTLDQITEFLRGAFACRHASVWLVEDGELRCRSGSEPEGNAPRVSLRGDDLERLHETRIARVPSPDEEGWLDPSTEASPFLRATLVSGDEVLGALVVGDRIHAADFDERDLEILAHVTHTAASADNNRLQSAELDRAYRASSAQALELASANERLRMLDRLKDDFLTFVSHELRTPLTVLSAVEFLEPGPRPDQAEVVKVLRNGYERLKRFIETALAYRAWIVGEPSHPDAILSLGDLVRLALSGLAVDPSESEIRVEIPEEPCLVRGGATELREVAQILLDNAVRFSPEKVWIRVRCEAEKEEVRLIVEDRGIGFRPELAEEILKPFTIADSLHHRSGSALHLAKANAIVIAHGGSIRSESKGEGTGARFIVTLPRVTDAVQAPRR
jgi:signal transduction histidine kinase/FixJ family two-component response regulator